MVAEPAERAPSPLSSRSTVPMTVARSAFAHWHMISPTPPAAAWTKCIAGLHVVNRPQQHPDCHALKHHRGRLSNEISSGSFTSRCVDQPLFRIAADRPGVSDAIARGDTGHALANRLDDPPRLPCPA